MLPRKICFIGLQILATLHIAHSFVLLTANIEDVKKLARNLLSDKFAEHIIELFAKATSNLVSPAPGVSEENEANVAGIQQVSDNEVIEQYKGRQGPKLAMRTTPSRHADNNSRGVERPKQMSDNEVIETKERQEAKLAMRTTPSRHTDKDSKEVVRPKQKVNSNYAESDLRSQELTELSEYRNPLKIPTIKVKESTIDRKLQNILRQSLQPQYLVSYKPGWDKETIQLSNSEPKKPKFSYHKSKTPENSPNVGAQYASVNVGGQNREKNNNSPSEKAYYPTTEHKERRPKVLDLKYQEKKNRKKELFGKDIKRVEVKPKNTNKKSFDVVTDKNTSKSDTLRMFVQNGGQLQELTTKRERMELSQYEPKKRAQNPKKSKYKISEK